MTIENKADRIKTKLAALLARTVENGCTEAEALVAAATAARIMAEHGITEADVKAAEVANDPNAFRTWTSPRDRLTALFNRHCNRAVAIFCDVSSYKLRATGPDVRHYAGFAPDVELALFIRTVVLRAVESETFVWEFAHLDNRETREDFQLGMLHRIAERLREMKAAQLAGRVAGTALVASKKGAVLAWLKREHNIVLSPGRKTSWRVADADAYGAGRAAGERVGLHRPVGATRRGGPAGLLN